MEAKNSRLKNEGIQVLRVLACLGVFLVHFGQRMSFDGIIRDITDFGALGVQMFFIISGYLACFSLNSNKNVLTYYKKKAVRILPLYFLCILYYMITETFIFKTIPADPLNIGWWRYIFFLNGIFPGDNYFWSNLGITWTIPVFVLFYIISPIILKFVKSTKSAVVCFFLWCGIKIAVNHFMNGYFSALTYMMFFVLGIIAYYVKKEKNEIPAIAILVIFAIGMWVLHVSLLAYSLLFTVLIILSDYLTITNKTICRVINVVDDHSYTLYLVHGIVFCGFIDKFHYPMLLRLCIALFGTFLATAVVHRFFEIPIQKQLRKLLKCF